MRIPWWIKYGALLVGLCVAYDLHSHYANWGRAAVVTFGTGLAGLGVSWKRFADKWWPFFIALAFPVAMPLVNDLRAMEPAWAVCEVTGAYRTYHPGSHSRSSARSASLSHPLLALQCPDGAVRVSARRAPGMSYERGDSVVLKSGLLGFRRVWRPYVDREAGLL